jgi:tRNA threonylcarbamoyladenosine biosynthesis protein TsaB
MSKLNILALDTSGQIPSAALLSSGVITKRVASHPQAQSQQILQLIDELLIEQKLLIENLSAIAFAHGPGSFTGLRVGAAVVQGLAFSANLPVIGISTLKMYAQAAYTTHGYQDVLVANDARMQEVYWGIYQLDKASNIMININGEHVNKPDEIVFLPVGTKLWPIGTGWFEYPSLYGQCFSDTVEQMCITKLQPSAVDLLFIAQHNFINNKFVSANMALPVYIRNNVVQKNIKNN